MEHPAAAHAHQQEQTQQGQKQPPSAAANPTRVEESQTQEEAAPPEGPKTPGIQTNLHPDLHPLAEKYGEELVLFALSLGRAVHALHWFKNMARKNLHIRQPLQGLDQSINHFCAIICEEKSWQQSVVMECLKEIGEVRRQAGPQLVVPR